MGYLPGDLISTDGADAVRFFERSPGEGPTFAGHTAGIACKGWVNEALTTITNTPWDLWLSKHPDFEIHRLVGLTIQQRIALGKTAKQGTGNLYAPLKLGAHLTDWAIAWVRWGLTFGQWEGEARVARRLLPALGIKGFEICSMHWAMVYDNTLHYREWGDPLMVNPDDMHDFIVASPRWKMVAKRENGVFTVNA